MTAAGFAARLNAHRTGAGRWQARCPAHQDRSPSLSIREGQQGRTLVRCWAGCTIEAVLTAAGLGWHDLFDGAPPSPRQAAAPAQMRALAESQARELRIAHGRVCDRLLKLERIGDELAAKLARLPDDSPDGNALTRLFHQVQDRIRRAEYDELEARP